MWCAEMRLGVRRTAALVAIAIAVSAVSVCAVAAPLVAQPRDGGPAGSRRAPVAVECDLLDPSCIPPEPRREFRGVWVASVSNIDWPSRPGLSTAAAKRELVALLDRAKEAGLNAVILQVRPSGDALYASALEPWSEYLTGAQGRAPKPAWDPLAFAVAEAHRRGLELHAWFNPYRARHPSAKGPLAPSHAASRDPGVVKRYGAHLWMDPGEPSVRAHTLAVVLDVVRRYDVDGVHIDDYFYPYRERDARGVIDFPDSSSYARYVAGGGELPRADWRRENVNTLVRELHEGIHAVKPGVKFGVSPFGIWRPGYPWQVRGLDAHGELYADARRWLREGWVDYFSPQLYWPVDQVPQAYPVLLRWWSQQNAHGRHMWPGNYASKVGEPGRTAWLAPEIVRQVEVTRREAGASGNVHFSAKAFMEDRDSLATRLARGAYAELALVPASPWLAVERQGAPSLDARMSRTGTVTLRVTPATKESPRWWLVQRHSAADGWRDELADGGIRELPLGRAAERIAVRGVDRSGVVGPVTVVQIVSR